ncbi:uncharacterized protein LOC116001157 [Ipomoea triloba]|uniref:uncharacterized protein LOC116001157 n=1 Tax=Ipomoea triloba TaxID=35885 RepID=UPI00125E576A|nr:uncharacterized protein LOC116001157 [Ipomoea triloba]
MSISATSHSSETSSSHTKPKKDRHAGSSRGLARGVLDQVRAEFNKWKKEQAEVDPRGMESNLHRALFVQDIMDQPYPMDLRVLGSKDYSRRTDPEEHVNSYYGNMLMMGVSDAVMCRAFYSTLSGRAAEWFASLEPGSIADFSELARKFVHPFAISRTAKKHFTSLEKAKQREGESLTLFSERWKAAVAEIEPVDDRTAVNLLLSVLRAGPLYQDLVLNQPNTYKEALRRMTDHAIAEEANAAKRMQESGGQGRRNLR